MPLAFSRSAIALPDGLGALALPPLAPFVERRLQRRLDRRGRRDRRAGAVVDDLHVDVRHAAEHRQPRPLGRAGDALAQPQLDAVAAIFLRLESSSSLLSLDSAADSSQALRTPHSSTSALTRPSCRPSSSALRRCSARPSACTGRACAARRMLAATWPTSCRSTPVTVTCVWLAHGHVDPLRDVEHAPGASSRARTRPAGPSPRRGSRRRRCRAPS